MPPLQFIELHMKLMMRILQIPVFVARLMQPLRNGFVRQHMHPPLDITRSSV